MQVLKKTRDKLFEIIENTLKNDPARMTEQEKEYVDALILAWGTIGRVIEIAEVKDPPDKIRDYIFKDIHERLKNTEE